MLARKPGLWAGLCLAAALGTAAASAQTAPPLEAADLRAGETDLRGASPADALPDLPEAAAADPAASPSTDPGDASEKRRPPQRKRGELPKLAPYPHADRLGLRGGAETLPEPPPPTVAALPPAPQRRKIKPDDKPFDPVGLRVGDLKLTPYVEQSVGYATNPYGEPGAAKGSAYSATEVGVGLESDWSRNSLTGSAKLGYNAYFSTPGANAPYGSGLLDYRYDVSRDLSFDTEGRFNLTTETNAQLGLAGVASQSLTQVATYGATLGGTQNFGDLSLGLHGTIDRTQYGGDLADENYNDYGLKLRVGYRLSEAVQPFAEVDGDTRVYDAQTDASGYDRASDGIAGKAGVKLALSPMVNGEASVGYGAREYRDARLPDVGAPLFDASLIWAPTALTTVTLKASTLLQDAVVAGASADINRAYTINLDHALTDRFKLGVSGAISTDHYVGVNETDRSYTLGATAEYHVSREIVLKASATHQRFESNIPGSSYTADTVLVGVRLQR